MKKIIFTALLVATMAAPAFALTLGEKNQLEEWKQFMASDDSYADYFKERCGYDLPVTLDEALVPPFMAANTSASSYCDAARSSMSGMCESSAISKEAIAAKIKTLTCHYKEGDKGTFALTPESALSFTFGTEAVNIDEITKEWLEKNL